MVFEKNVRVTVNFYEKIFSSYMESHDIKKLIESCFANNIHPQKKSFLTATFEGLRIVSFKTE